MSEHTNTPPERTPANPPVAMPDFSGLNLYNLESSLVVAAEHYQECLEAFEDWENITERHPSEQNQDQLEELQDDLNEASTMLAGFFQGSLSKRDNMARYILHCEAQAKLAKQEMDRLAARRRTFENRAKHLKDYVASLMGHLGVTKLEGETATFSRRKSPRQVAVLDLEELPETYKELVPAYWKPDKISIGKVLRKGGEVKGAKLEEQTYHVRIS